MSLPRPAEGPPYPPRVAGVGGVPTVIPDIPICAVFISMYLAFAVTNFTLFNLNRRKGHFFLPNALLGGFCMARILTCCLRIGWATNHHDISLSIAANIFVNIGVLIVYIVNVLFAQRILRAKQPKIGWSRISKAVFTALYAGLVIAIIMLIVLIIHSFYSLEIEVQKIAEWVERGALVYLMIFTAAPLVVMAIAFGLPRSDAAETFGHGSVESKGVILLVTTCLCLTISGFKVGVFWSPPRPINDPAWYDSKAAFYCFDFMIDILILTTYTAAQMYKRFHVPDGSSKRRTYVVPVDVDEKLAKMEELHTSSSLDTPMA